MTVTQAAQSTQPAMTESLPPVRTGDEVEAERERASSLLWHYTIKHFDPIGKDLTSKQNLPSAKAHDKIKKLLRLSLDQISKHFTIS